MDLRTIWREISSARRIALPLAVVALFAIVLGAAADEQSPTSPAQAAGFFDGLAAVLQKQPLLLLVMIIALGMAIGSVNLGGLSLGTSGVLFSALLIGHLANGHAWKLPSGIGSLGLALFVYAVGLGAGPTFFRSFRDQGKRLAILTLVAAASAVAITVLFARLWNLPADLTAGIFAGAMTTTPGLAAALEACSQAGLSPEAVSVGYGLTYPVGLLVVVLFAQLLPRLMRVDLDELGRQLRNTKRQAKTISRHLVEIANPAVYGKRIHELPVLETTEGQITRVLQNGRLVPIGPDHQFEEGQVVLLVAEQAQAELLTMVLGKKSEAPSLIDADHDRLEIVITAPELLGKTLRELQLHARYGVTISRIERYGMTFVPKSDTVLAMADRAVVVGPPDALQQFLRIAGHKERKLHETDLMSLGIGLTLGILLGLVPLNIPGAGTLTLGLAGGPLLAGLLFGHFGRFLGMVGYMPLAARMFAQELGLAFFLAEAGFAAGGDVLATLEAQGPLPLALALIIVATPLATCYAVARWVFGVNLLEALGGTCGAMTSTAAVGAITSKTDSDIPITSYAAAYPVGLVLMNISTRILVMLMR